MDIFRFLNPTNPSKMEQGRIVQGIKTAMWVERYQEAGEFEIVADVSSGIQDALPIDSFISHIRSDQIMIVEDHQITDDGEKDPEVTVTGRSFETFLDQRVAGSDLSSPIADYESPANDSWDQAVYLMRNHIYASELVDDSNAIPYFDVVSEIEGDVGTNELRVIKRGSLYAAVLDILKVDDLGIKVLRPKRTGGLATDSANSVIVVHDGIDRSDTVVFSHSAGDIANADYLWSNRKKKDCAFVVGKWVQVLVDSSSEGVNRRMLFVDGTDIDQAQTEMPTGTALSWIQAAMDICGKEALAAQRTISLAKAEISKDGQQPVYRSDYNIGDIVSVDGGYNTTRVYRVTEHVEIDDENGAHAYPSLTALEEEEP